MSVTIATKKIIFVFSVIIGEIGLFFLSAIFSIFAIYIIDLLENKLGYENTKDCTGLGCEFNRYYIVYSVILILTILVCFIKKYKYLSLNLFVVYLGLMFGTLFWEASMGV